MIGGNGREACRQIRAIEGRLFAGRLCFKTADTDEITVESAGTQEKLGFRAYERDGVLHLQTARRSVHCEKGSITVTLPEGVSLGEIDLEPQASKRLTAGSLRAERLTVVSDAGQVSIRDFSGKNVRFECGAGAFSGSGGAAETLAVTCGVGAVELRLKGSRRDYAHTLRCGIGEIRCGGERYSGFGNQVCLEPQASKRLTAECGIGRIDIRYEAEP